MKVNAISLNDTNFYNIAETDKPLIKEIRTVYIYNPESCTHLCELTPSYELRYLYTYILYSEDIIDDDVRDSLEERYCNLDYQDTYMHCSDVGRMSSAECSPDFEDMEEAVEYLQGNWPI